MTRLERIVLRHQIDAARRRRLEEEGSLESRGPNDVDQTLRAHFPDYDPPPRVSTPGDWMPQCARDNDVHHLRRGWRDAIPGRYGWS